MIEPSGPLPAISFLSSVDSYNPVTDYVTQLPPLPTARSHVGCCALSLQGSEQRCGNHVSSDLSNGSTSDSSSSSSSSSGGGPNEPHISCDGLRPPSSGQFIFAIGGVGKDGPLATVEAWSQASNKWYSCPPLPEPRVNCLAEACGNKIVVVGGSATSEQVSSPVMTVLVLDITALRFQSPRGVPAALRAVSWQVVATLPVARWGFRTTVLHSKLCVLGEGFDLLSYAGTGESQRGACFNAPIVLDPETGEWKVWRFGAKTEPSTLRPLSGVERRLECSHSSCRSYREGSYACVSLNNELYLVRRCDAGRNVYCRHIHRFQPDQAVTSFGAAWSCLERPRAYSSLLAEAGDCWEHSVAIKITC